MLHLATTSLRLVMPCLVMSGNAPLAISYLVMPPPVMWCLVMSSPSMHSSYWMQHLKPHLVPQTYPTWKTSLQVHVLIAYIWKNTPSIVHPTHRHNLLYSASNRLDLGIGGTNYRGTLLARKQGSGVECCSFFFSPLPSFLHPPSIPSFIPPHPPFLSPFLTP